MTTSVSTYKITRSLDENSLRHFLDHSLSLSSQLFTSSEARASCCDFLFTKQWYSGVVNQKLRRCGISFILKVHKANDQAEPCILAFRLTRFCLLSSSISLSTLTVQHWWPLQGPATPLRVVHIFLYFKLHVSESCPIPQNLRSIFFGES